ncbi:IS66 family insertion sequence element accessory protein TnpA [Anaerobutyricum hallii]|uniref:IS66 family insertion sequence element accessory protein TnpA n=1 Tax=Anaerobutyricum hallii TaxID=39488 RepID=UPI003FA465BC
MIDDQKNSHLTIKKYCDINHIAESSFYKNKAKLTGVSSKSDRNMHSHFIPAVLTDKMTDMITLKLDGYEISCTEDVLRKIVKAL